MGSDKSLSFQEDLNGLTTLSSMVYANRTINWNDLSNGTYSSSLAAVDFGNVLAGWVDSRIAIHDSTCRVTLLANSIASPSGVAAEINITDGSEYELEFDVKFDENFPFARRGKVGFGLLIGQGNTGGNPATDGNGGSLRVMWETDGADTIFQPYIYYKDQPGDFGQTFGRRYPETGSIVKGQWYTIKLYAKSNTGSNTDGIVRMHVNGETVLSRTIRWTTSNSERLVKRLAFSTFRGGESIPGEAQASYDSYIYLDNLRWKRLSL